jgi:hypothetical protein
MKLSPRFDDTQEFRAHTELHTSNDSDKFSTDASANQTGIIPVYTGATFNIWQPDYGAPYAYAKKITTDYILEKAKRGMTNKSSPFYEKSIKTVEDLPFKYARVAFRDVTNSTNTRSCIVCLIPPNVFLVEKSPYLIRLSTNPTSEAYILGILSSIPLDWNLRRLVELKLSYEILNSLPIPRPDTDDPRRHRVITIAGRLAAVDARYQAWADAVGVPVGSVTSAAIKDDLIAELDALVAHLYGLNRSQLCHIFATFHRGWAYQPRLARVLSFYDQLPGVPA